MKNIANRKRRKEKSEKGFTLIELLVVISIIALMSTVVLGSLEDARSKSRNARKNEVVAQYVNALELYRSEAVDGTYPNYGDATQLSPTTANFACIGYEGPADTCFGIFGTQGQAIVNNALDDYFGELPKEDETINVGIMGDLKGVVYACKSSTNCNGYSMQWILEGVDSNCGPGEPKNPDYLDLGIVTRCSIEK